MEVRRAELVQSLVPQPGEDADDVIYGILAGGNTFGMSDREAAIRVRIYAEALQKHPTWAIEQARKTFQAGGWKCNWDGQGIPSSASVNAECSFITLQIEAEIAKLNQVLDAEIVDNEATDLERQKAVEAWTKLRAEIGASNILSERTSEEITRERESMAKANERFRARAEAHRKSLAEQAEQQVAG